MNKIALLNSAIYPFFCKIVKIVSLRVRFSKQKGNSLTIGNDSLLRKSKISIKGGNNIIIVNNKCRFRNCLIDVSGNNNYIEIGEGVLIYENAYISIKGDNCSIHIGNRTTIGSAKFFVEEGSTSIEVGKDCMFGRKVCLQTTDFHSIIDTSTKQRINPPKSIRIGDHVWLGYGVTISKGGELSNNSVVGEQSVVTKAFPQSHILIAGIPARILKENIDWSRDKL